MKNTNNISTQWLSIKASAGSGKTFMLTLRYIYLLLCGAKPSEILSITFTNKAQAEMKERIFNTLKDLANLPQNGRNDYFDNLVEIGLRENYIRENITQAYKTFIQSHNHIMTFDAFFNSILKKFSFYEGLSSAYELGGDFNFDGEVFERVLRKMNEKNFRELVHFCHQNRLNASSFLEMISQLSEFEVEIPQKSSFNKENLAYCVEDLRAFVLNVLDGKSGTHRLNNRFHTELSENLGRDEINLIVDKFLHLTDKMTEKLKSLIQDSAAYEQKVAALKAELKNYFDSKEAEILREIMDFSKDFRTLKSKTLKAKNQLSFADVSEFCFDLLNNNIDKDFFYFRLDSRINHILIDEFQDTNIKQYLILKPLFDEIKSGFGQIESKSLFFVGDEKQSIYAFRGSDSRLFNIISDSLGMQTLSLPKNFRSAKNIVEFVNATFCGVFENYTKQIPHSNKAGFVEVVSMEKDEILDAVRERVELLRENNSGEIAILTRGNDSASEIAEYLKAHIQGLKIALQTRGNENNVEFLIIQNALKYLQTREILYLKNCLKLNGESYESERDLLDEMQKLFGKNLAPRDNPSTKIDGFEYKKTPSQIVLFVMEFFNLYSKSAMSVLESAIEFVSLEELILHLETISLQIDESKEFDVRIMNIHNSKGLEFDNVILTELKDERNHSDAFYSDYDGLELERIYYFKDSTHRAVVDSHFAKIMAKREAEKKADNNNLLYVAFTRARESLYLIQHKNSIFKTMLNLSDTIIGKMEVKPKIADSSPQNQPLLISQKAFGKQSDFTTLDSKPYSTKGRIRGIGLHLALEHTLKFGGDSILRDILLNRFGILLDSSDIEWILQSKNRILDNKILRDLLENPDYINCEVVLNGENLACENDGQNESLDKKNERKNFVRIDCLIEKNNQFYILDYKSSDADLESKKSQVRQYAEIVKAKFGKEVSAFLCFSSGEMLKV